MTHSNCMFQLHQYSIVKHKVWSHAHIYWMNLLLDQRTTRCNQSFKWSSKDMILHNVQHYVINHSHLNSTVMSMPMNVSLNLRLCCVILSFVHLGFSIYLNEPPVLSQDQVFKGSYNIKSRCHQKTRAFPVFCGVCGTIATFTWLLCTIQHVMYGVASAININRCPDEELHTSTHNPLPLALRCDFQVFLKTFMSQKVFRVECSFLKTKNYFGFSASLNIIAY